MSALVAHSNMTYLTEQLCIKGWDGQSISHESLALFFPSVNPFYNHAFLYGHTVNIMFTLLEYSFIYYSFYNIAVNCFITYLHIKVLKTEFIAFHLYIIIGLGWIKTRAIQQAIWKNPVSTCRPDCCQFICHSRKRKVLSNAEPLTYKNSWNIQNP